LEPWGRDALSNRYLLTWMFGFLRNVKPQVGFAMLWLAMAAGVEVLTVRQSGQGGQRHSALHEATVASNANRQAGKPAPQWVLRWFPRHRPGRCATPTHAVRLRPAHRGAASSCAT